MDFVRILRSLEELLYELMTWIVLYPRTLWRSAVSPLEMLRYSQREVADSLDQQYTETLSPVLFLMLTLALSHAVDQAVAPDRAELRGGLLGRLMSSEQNQLVTRSVAFAIFATVRATSPTAPSRRADARPQHASPAILRQCYLAAVFAFTLGLSSIMLRWTDCSVPGRGHRRRVGVVVRHRAGALAAGVSQRRWLVRWRSLGLEFREGERHCVDGRFGPFMD